jgi:hypothetical protein
MMANEIRLKKSHGEAGKDVRLIPVVVTRSARLKMISSESYGGGKQTDNGEFA